MSLFTTLIPSFTRTPVRRGASPADPGPTVKPHYDVNETDSAFGVTVHLPGVTKDGLELTAEAGQFRIIGRRAWKQPEGWTALRRESVDVPYELVLTHDNAIDSGKIHAEIRDGVLRLALPKTEAIKPRKIAVN